MPTHTNDLAVEQPLVVDVETCFTRTEDRCPEAFEVAFVTASGFERWHVETSQIASL